MTLEPQNSDFPANKHFAITPADTDLAVVPRTIRVGAASTATGIIGLY